VEQEIDAHNSTNIAFTVSKQKARGDPYRGACIDFQKDEM
jgi:hypothetical protein